MSFGAGHRAGFLAWGAVVGLVQAFSACGQTVTVGVDDPPGGAGGMTAAGGGGGLELGGAGSASGGTDALPDGGEPPCRPAECRGKIYECGDCKDNDDDGLVDAFDPACLGPCDDDEDGLSTGLSSTAAACRQDCYFDGDAGPGNDKCDWSHQCDPLSVAPSYPPSGEMRCAYDSSNAVSCREASQTQPSQCVTSCLPLVPNGCDCFGCCELPARSGQYRYVGAGRGSLRCTLEALEDTQACPPCTPVQGCINDCKLCETCVGSGPDPSCEPRAECDAGRDACDADSPCGPGFYCLTGCCTLTPVR